jgi:type II secretory pathway pseudopilin PulG
MKVKTLIIEILLLIVLLGAIGILAKTAVNQKQRIKVLKENTENLAQMEQSYTVKLLKSQQNEATLRRMFQKQSAILDSLKTKWADVPRVSTVYVTNTDTVTDTVHVPQFIAIETDWEYQDWHITDGCFDLSGKAYMDFTIEQKSYTDTLFIVPVSGERRRLFGWSWTPRWGRQKPDTVRTWSNCGDVRAMILEKVER